MQHVLHDPETQDGALLLLFCLVHPLDNVIEIVSLLVQIDRPVLQVGVQFKHDQAKTEAYSRQKARNEEIYHQ